MPEVPAGVDAFISYSRRDAGFVERLRSALDDHGCRCWVDERDIPATAPWMQEVRTAVERADAFIFVISPDSVASEICETELAHAVRLNKRLVPVLYRDTPTDTIPAALAERNWISVNDTDSFDSGVASVAVALDTDLDRARAHTRLLVRALEWAEAERDASLALRGRDLAGAEEWLTEGAAQAEPRPTQLQTEYVISSRRLATRAQRVRTGVLSLGLLIALGLAGFALVQRNRADDQAKDSRSRELAARALLDQTTSPLRSLVLAVQAAKTADTPEAQRALRSVWEDVSLQRTLVGHRGPVNGVAFSPDAERAVTGSGDGTVRVWDTAEARPLRRFAPDAGPILDVAMSSDGEHVAGAAGQGSAYVWNLENGSQEAALEGHRQQVLSVDFSPDGRQVVTTGIDGQVLVWNTQRQKVVQRYTEHEGRVLDATFSPDGRSIVSSGNDGTARVWTVGAGRTLAEFRSGASVPVNAARFSPGGQRVITADDLGTARVWNVRTEQLLFELPQSAEELYSASFDPSDGNRVLTAGLDGTAQVWGLRRNASSNKREAFLITSLRGHTGNVLSAAFSPDGDQVVTGSGDKTARIWDATGDDAETVYEAHASAVLGVAFEPNSTQVVTVSADGTAKGWDPESGRTTDSVQLGDVIWDVSFSPQGRAALALDDGFVALWRPGAAHAKRTAFRSSDLVYGASFAPSGDALLVTGADESVIIAPSGEELVRLKGQTGDILGSAFSPDGGRVATASTDGTVYLWDSQTGAVMSVLEGHTDEVRSVAFSPDGQELVTASEDETARIWDAASGDVRLVLRGHSEGVFSASFNPSGSRVATGSADRTVRIWDAATGESLDTLKGHSELVHDVAFSPDGELIVSTSYDDTARVFRCELCISDAELLELAETRLPSILTPAEHAEYLAEAG